MLLCRQSDWWAVRRRVRRFAPPSQMMDATVLQPLDLRFREMVLAGFGRLWDNGAPVKGSPTAPQDTQTERENKISLCFTQTDIQADWWAAFNCAELKTANQINQCAPARFFPFAVFELRSTWLRCMMLEDAQRTLFQYNRFVSLWSHFVALYYSFASLSSRFVSFCVSLELFLHIFLAGLCPFGLILHPCVVVLHLFVVGLCLFVVILHLCSHFTSLSSHFRTITATSITGSAQGFEGSGAPGLVSSRPVH